MRRLSHPSVIVLRFASLVALAFSSATAVDYYGPGETFCQSGGGCEVVRFFALTSGGGLGMLLPATGMVAFTVLFLGTLFLRRGPLRLTAIAAIVGGLIGLGLLLLQWQVIGAWCSLCLGVDGGALVAGAMGIWMVVADVGEPKAKDTLLGPWWGLYWIAAFGPLVYAFAYPDPELPEAIREVWDEEADLNVVEMADFECPYCRRMHPVLMSVLEGTDADVRLTRILVPLSFHTHARHGAHAYFCAEAQGNRQDEMADVLFDMPIDEMTPEGLVGIAGAMGLDVDAFRACLADPAIDARVEEDIARADRAGMAGLPTVYVGERRLLGFDEGEGPAPYRDALEAALAGEGRRERPWAFGVLGAISLLTFLLGFQYWRRGASLTRPRTDAASPDAASPDAASPDAASPDAPLSEPKRRRRKRKR